MATLVALLGAMFVSLQSVSAATGDVDAVRGTCATVDSKLVAQHSVDGSATTIEYVSKVAADGTESKSDVECPAGTMAGDHVKITPTDGKPEVVYQAPVFYLALGDSDGVVRPDATVTATPGVLYYNNNKLLGVKSRSFIVTGSLALHSTGGVADGDDRSSDSGHVAFPASLTGDALTKTIVVPDGTTAGEYTVSIKFLYDHDGDSGSDLAANPIPGSKLKEYTVSRTITVGDPGKEAGEVTVELSYDKPEDPKTAKVDQTQETGNAEAEGGEIRLRVNTRNTLGNPANKGNIASIIVTAGGSTLTLKGISSTGAEVLVTADGTMDGAEVGSGSTNTVTIKGENIVSGGTSDVYALVTKTNEKPGIVTVSATVVGTDGSVATSNSLTLGFTGSGTALSVGDPKSVAPGGKSEFSLSVTDGAGNDVSSTGALYSFSIKDAEGKPVTNSAVMKVEESTVGSSTATILDNNPRAAAALITVGVTAKPGVYSIDASIRGIADSKQTVEFVVAGSADTVELAADPETGDAAMHEVIAVTATVLDKNGAPVADGTRVEFARAGSSLSPIGSGHDPIETVTEVVGAAVTEDGETTIETKNVDVTKGGALTKDGEATVRYLVSGAGAAVVSATAGTKNNTLVVTTTDSAAEAEEAMPEEEASVSCLSELSGFATWSCGVEADASEIFDMVSGRGVTALHLWNGSTWVRYSVVDGAMVPGSSDFMVTKSDILYISN